VILTNSERSQRFVAEIAGDWARWCGLGAVKMTRSMRSVARTLTVALGLLLFAAVAIAGAILHGLGSGTRHFVPTSVVARRRRLAGVAVALAALILWWGALHGLILDRFPVLTPWLAGTLTACSTLGLLLALFPPREAARANR
jgi:hypothetical protein